MMIKHRGAEPHIDSSVFIAPTAVIAGDVTVGPRTRIMYGAVIDSEASKVNIGECTIVCENSVIRATAIGDPVKVYSPGDKDAVVDAIKSIAFTKIAFGVDPQPENRVSTMTRVTEIRSKEFESHFDDILL